MVVTVTIDPSWFGHPAALAEFLTRVRLLERPAPALSPAREPGDDDLAELLAGMDDAPEQMLRPSQHPSPTAATTPKPAPAASKHFDGVPTTGKSLYRWAIDRKILPRVNAIGKGFSYPKLISDWEPTQVATAYRILGTEAATNGKAH